METKLPPPREAITHQVTAHRLTRPGNPQYRRLQNGVAGHLRAITADLADGTMTPFLWADQFSAILLDGHAEAWTLGRQRAGDFRARHGLDDVMARAANDRQNEFLSGFLSDVQGGRYQLEDGSLNVAAVNARANLYAGSLKGTANEAFVEAGDDDELYDWILGGVEKHCSQCPEIASLSPYTRATLFTYPGAGDTPCLGNCKCRLVRRSDGLSGFHTGD